MLLQVHQDSTIRHRPRRKECCTHRWGEKKREGVGFSISYSVNLSCLQLLIDSGCHPVHGRRARRGGFHPWLDNRLGREAMWNSAFVEDDVVEPFSPGAHNNSSPLPEPGSPLAPALADNVEPFGTLLFTLASTGRRSGGVQARRGQ